CETSRPRLVGERAEGHTRDAAGVPLVVPARGHLPADRSRDEPILAPSAAGGRCRRREAQAVYPVAARRSGTAERRRGGIDPLHVARRAHRELALAEGADEERAARGRQKVAPPEAGGEA